jgi:hypothetical protein
MTRHFKPAEEDQTRKRLGPTVLSGLWAGAQVGHERSWRAKTQVNLTAGPAARTGVCSGATAGEFAAGGGLKKRELNASKREVTQKITLI